MRVITRCGYYRKWFVRVDRGQPPGAKFSPTDNCPENNNHHKKHPSDHNYSTMPSPPSLHHTTPPIWTATNQITIITQFHNTTNKKHHQSIDNNSNTTQHFHIPMSTDSSIQHDQVLPQALRYSPADPNNNMIFNRVPYAKRLHWLWLWNPDNNPEHIDCKVAMETLTYFTSHQTQHQQRYYFGTYHGIADAKKDLEICMSVRSQLAVDPEGARKLLESRSAEKEYEPEHVWKFRTVPLKLETP